MVNRNVLIGKVSPFLGKREIIVGNQDTTDIIDALIKNHYKYANEYDKIFRYFDGGNVEETAYNIWQFLKNDFKYTIEPEKMQVLRSPAAILASNIIGIDCKGYATFANGVLDAYRRNTGKKFDVYYRFASYDPFDNTPQHVFAVVNDNGNEYWIDPVLEEFDEKKQPYYYKDKKIKKMALVAMSGINDPSYFDEYGNLINYTGGADILDESGSPVSQSSGGSNWFQTILNAAPSILKALPQNQPTYGGYGGGYNVNPYGSYAQPAQQQTSGISTNTILLIGAAGLAAYFIFKKK
jgi:hypothetical protein